MPNDGRKMFRFLFFFMIFFVFMFFVVLRVNRNGSAQQYQPHDDFSYRTEWLHMHAPHSTLRPTQISRWSAALLVLPHSPKSEFYKDPSTLLLRLTILHVCLAPPVPNP